MTFFGILYFFFRKKSSRSFLVRCCFFFWNTTLLSFSNLYLYDFLVKATLFLLCNKVNGFIVKLFIFNVLLAGEKGVLKCQMMAAEILPSTRHLSCQKGHAEMDFS